MIFVRGLILAWLLVGSQCAAQALTAGAAKSNITPAIGEDIVGGFLPIPSTYIHDDLFAKCVVLDNDETRIALVVCDLLGIQ